MRDTFFLRGTTSGWLAGGGAAALGLGLAAAAVTNAVSSTVSAAGSAVLAGGVALAVSLPLLYTCSRMAKRIAALRREVQHLGQRDGLSAGRQLDAAHRVAMRKPSVRAVELPTPSRAVNTAR